MMLQKKEDGEVAAAHHKRMAGLKAKLMADSPGMLFGAVDVGATAYW